METPVLFRQVLRRVGNIVLGCDPVCRGTFGQRYSESCRRQVSVFRLQTRNLSLFPRSGSCCGSVEGMSEVNRQLRRCSLGIYMGNRAADTRYRFFKVVRRTHRRGPAISRVHVVALAPQTSKTLSIFGDGELMSGISEIQNIRFATYLASATGKRTLRIFFPPR